MSKQDPTSKKIKKVLEGHSHYDKNYLPWVLDSYHKECIHHGIDQISKRQDIILLSDIDEIPKRKEISNLITNNPKYLIDFQQSEFCYSVNFHKENN